MEPNTDFNVALIASRLRPVGVWAPEDAAGILPRRAPWASRHFWYRNCCQVEKGASWDVRRTRWRAWYSPCRRPLSSCKWRQTTAGSRERERCTRRSPCARWIRNSPLACRCPKTTRSVRETRRWASPRPAAESNSISVPVRHGGSKIDRAIKRTSESVMVTTDGATATLTSRHWSAGTWFTIWSIASFNTSMPLGRDTCKLPTYLALSTLRGSSIGVGKLWPAYNKGGTLMKRGVNRRETTYSTKGTGRFCCCGGAAPRASCSACCCASRWAGCCSRSSLSSWPERRSSLPYRLVQITALRLEKRCDGLPFSTDLLCWRLRSIMIFLQMSLSVLAIVLAGVSHRKTWHMCLRVTRSRATYAKSLYSAR